MLLILANNVDAPLLQKITQTAKTSRHIGDIAQSVQNQRVSSTKNKKLGRTEPRNKKKEFQNKLKD